MLRNIGRFADIRGVSLTASRYLDIPMTRPPLSGMNDPDFSRRRFLAFLGASPLLAAAGYDSDLLDRLAGESPKGAQRVLDLAHQALQQDTLPVAGIRAPLEALSVFDFEPVAKQKIPVAHWGYLNTGTDDDRTIQANREGFDHWALRPRRLIDVSKVDASVTLYGTKYPTPIVINPVGSQKAFHPEAEVAVAKVLCPP